MSASVCGASPQPFGEKISQISAGCVSVAVMDVGGEAPYLRRDEDHTFSPFFLGGRAEIKAVLSSILTFDLSLQS